MKYLILYGSCGHGHQRAAEYLAEELRSRGETDVHVLDFLDYTTSFFRSSYKTTYQFAVTYISLLWKWGFDITNLKCLHWLVRPIRRFANRMHAAQLHSFLTKENPDYIILTHFLASEIASYLKEKGKITSHIVTIVTDTQAHATWVNRGSDYFIGFSDETKEGLKKWNIPSDKIHVFGIPISSKFQLQDMRDEYREKHGLRKDLLTILLTSGSFGIGPTSDLVRALDTYHGDVQVVVVCGNNKNLFRTLMEQEYTIPVKILPFIDYMDELMEASDLVIAKSGGLTMCESLAKELPMIISKPIPGQETYNKSFLMAHDAAFSIHHVKDIHPIVQSIIKDRTLLEQKKRNIRSIHKPYATKDIVDFLNRIA